MQLSRWRVIATVLLPWLTAKLVFKPRIGPLRTDRILDRLAFWRSVVGTVAIMVSTYDYQHVLYVSSSIFLKAVQTGAYALLLPPLSFLVMLVVTRPGRRAQLMPGARRLLGRGAPALTFFFLPFFLLNLGSGQQIDITIPDPGVAIFFIPAIPLMIAWFCCFWCCTIYWAARTGLWTGEIHPLLAPIGTTLLMLLINGQEIIEGDTKGVPYWLWLTLNLCGTATSLVLSVLEYRHLRSIGYQFRSGPEPVTSSEPEPVQ
ncbi:hypothetical protein ABZ297_35635 [Nonomuraea sp. NPDC005983]|uniref:hypothetical protein n=1 Tax=Nonomuraea sp. NPDC005983 TaxID=3155595 RepID=UPI0033B466C8